MNLNKIKKILMILQFLIPFVLVIAYCVNLYFALILQGPYWQMWVIITTAAIGASFPVWLVWYLNEKSQEEKHEKEFKEAVMLEYSKALANLGITVTVYRSWEKFLKNKQIKKIYIPKYKQHNLQTLIPISNRFTDDNYKNLQDGFISWLFLIEHKIQILQNYQLDLENQFHYKDFNNVTEQEKWLTNSETLFNMLGGILDNQGKLLNFIVSYVENVYDKELTKGLRELDAFKYFEQRMSKIIKKNNEKKEQEQNVSTEKLSE